MFAPLLCFQFCLLCAVAETGEVNSVEEVFRVKRDMNDVDMTDSSSDTSSTGGQEQDLDSGDPNLHNPQPNEGYGHEYANRYRHNSTSSSNYSNLMSGDIRRGWTRALVARRAKFQPGGRSLLGAGQPPPKPRPSP